MGLVIVQEIDDGFGLLVVEPGAGHVLHPLHDKGPLPKGHAGLKTSVQPMTSVAFIAEQLETLLNVRGKSGRIDLYLVAILCKWLKLSKGRTGSRGPEQPGDRHGVEQ